MAHLAHCPDNEYRLATSPKAASVATSTLSTSASLSAVDMNQLYLGCTKTPWAAHSAVHTSVNWWSVSPVHSDHPTPQWPTERESLPE